MQLLAIALAASLVLGPAPVESGTVAGPTEPAAAVEPEPASPLPDVDDPPGGDVEPEPEPEPVPEPEPEPEPPPPTVEQAEVTPAPAPAPAARDKLGCDGSKSCRRMTVAGIVVGTLGLAALGTGIGLRVKKNEVIPESPAFVTSTHPAGIVTLTLGIGVTLTAALMLVAAQRGYKQRAKNQARVAPLPNGLRF